jgi:hypothetical protein
VLRPPNWSSGIGAVHEVSKELDGYLVEGRDDCFLFRPLDARFRGDDESQELAMHAVCVLAA